LIKPTEARAFVNLPGCVFGRPVRVIPVAAFLILSKRETLRNPVARSGRHLPVCVVVVVKRQADLLQVVAALGPGGRFADLLDGGEEQSDQDRDDRDHHQQLDERETSTSGRQARHYYLRVEFGARRHPRAGDGAGYQTFATGMLSSRGPAETRSRESSTTL